MNKLLLCLLFIGLLLVSPLFGQTYSKTDQRCATMHVDSLAHLDDPHKNHLNNFEKWLNPLVEAYKAQEMASGTAKSYDVIYIPTVVHVIHNGEAVGTGTNISTAQIQSQIDVLNEDFRRLVGTRGFNASAVGTDTQIEFCLVTKTPANVTMPTPGVDRINRTTAGFTAPPYGSTAYIDGTIKPATVWNSNLYFNIWVLNLGGGLLGYAQFPETNLAGLGTAAQSANTDGVVILYSAFGSSDKGAFTLGAPYDKGRTATHEIGHWLGLRHIWGDGGCGLDDYCADTPESSAANFGACPVVVNCGNTNMTTNYMDYSDDPCMNIFTRDQRTRMRTVLYNSPRRSTLVNNGRCDPVITGLPQIYFNLSVSITDESSVGGTIGCRGYRDITIPVNISSAPTGAATVTFSLAGTASNGPDYTLPSPSVVFPNGGTASQNLTIRVFDDGAVETSETIILTYTITGATNAIAGTFNQTHTVTIDDNDYDPDFSTATVFSENFEASGGALPAGWSAVTEIAPTGANVWTVGTNGGMTGTYSCYITNNTGTKPLAYTANSTSNTRVRTPAINAVGRSNMTLSFSWRCVGEYVAATQEFYDYGHLMYSLDGTNYSIMPNATNGSITTQFANQNAAAVFSMTLPDFLNNTTFYLGWRWVNDNVTGTNPSFAIDNVLITAPVVTIETALSSTDDQYLGPNSRVYFYDNTTGKLMVCINNTTSHDYGCTNVSIDRAGTSAVAYQNVPVATHLTSKSFLITPTTNNAAGAYDITMYYVTGEVTGWQTASTNAWASCNIAKTGGNIFNITPGTPNANGATNYWGTANTTGVVTGGSFVKASFTSGFSGLAAGVFSSPPLPLDLLSFEGYPNTIGNALRWEVSPSSTAKEFVLERCTDNVNFERIYGLNREGNSYNYTDTDLSEEVYFYRLKKFNRDGHHEYSNIVEIHHTFNEQLLVMPNPVSNQLTIQLKAKNTQNMVLTLTNLTGQTLKQMSVTTQAGAQQWQWDMSDLPAGMYLLQSTNFKPIKIIKE